MVNQKYGRTYNNRVFDLFAFLQIDQIRKLDFFIKKRSVFLLTLYNTIKLI